MINLSSGYLLEIRRKALRRGIWFKILTRAERAILSLVPRCAETVKSPRLIGIIAKIIVKIKNTLKSPLERFKNQVGRPLARKISQIAQSLGHKEAEEWASNRGFIQYIAIIKMNDIPTFR